MRGRLYFLLFLLLPAACLSQVSKSTATVLNSNRVQATLSSEGVVGFAEPGQSVIDPFTNERVRFLTFPPRSSTYFKLSFNLSLAGRRLADTLVRYNFLNVNDSAGTFQYRSTSRNNPFYDPTAQATFEIITIYTDTFDCPQIPERCLRNENGDTYQPLGVVVKLRTLAWSTPRLREVVILEYEIVNVSTEELHDLYAVLAYDANIDDKSGDTIFNVPATMWGRLHQYSFDTDCEAEEIGLSYIHSDDGDPDGSVFDSRSTLASAGLRVLLLPPRTRESFDWFAAYGGANWSPQAYAGVKPFEMPQLGSPIVQSWFYEMLTRHERDYDKMTAYVPRSIDEWTFPPDSPDSGAIRRTATCYNGIGPIDLPAGTTTRIVVALCAADSLHTDPTAYERLFSPTNPYPFYNQLNFRPLAENARYADWVYDNPGYDSDGDGYLGEYRICDNDTVWYKGDGIPDFRADIPPTPPLVKIETADGSLHVRWNGYKTESSKDIFTNEVDFEGYRVYVGRDARESAMSLVTSYDKENFNRFRFVTLANGEGRWDVTELPFTLDSLKEIYADTAFDPFAYSRSNPLRVADSFFYFEKNDANNSSLTGINTIRKAYPDITTPPPADTSLWTDDMITTEHNGPRLPKYYEYEYVIDSLLPSVPWHVAITAFDFGFASGGLPPAESEIKSTLTTAFAQTSAQQVSEQKLEAYVYPNPYRIDAGYDVSGFENRDQYLPPDKARLIHFSNLPHRCTIHIYSLDGDRIITIEHDKAQDAPDAMHNSWDLITRNRQLITSGLYYFVIESPLRETQLGKFVVIK